MTSSGVKKIMEDALEALITREDELGKSLVKLRAEFEAAEREAKMVQTAIKEQRAALERLDHPRSRGSRGKGARPWSRHPPAEGTQAHKILATLSKLEDDGFTGSVGNISRVSELPPAKVRPILGELLNRQLVERVSEGIYKRVSSDTQK